MSNDGNGVDPWAFIAHKNGKWQGIASADLKDIGRTLGAWVKRGLTITTVHSRAEYNAVMDTLEAFE
jgi:hypothetical protein